MFVLELGQLGGLSHTTQLWVIFTKRLYNGDNFAISATLSDVCTLLSAILIFIVNNKQLRVEFTVCYFVTS